nr:alpha/beta hydrolase [Paenibacillus bovis]
MYRTGHFTANDGVKLFFRAWIPQEPKGFLILIHGAGEHSGRYAHIGETCLKENIGIIAPDLRGFGKSGGPRGHVNHFSDYIDDLEILINLFKKRYESAPLFIFGHSLGGLIAIRYGQLCPHKANGFILSSPALGIRIQLPMLLKKVLQFCSRVTPNLAIEPFKWMGRLKKIRTFNHLIPEPDKNIIQDPLFTLQYTPRWLMELIQNGISALLETPKFRFPFLCLYDQQDPIIHPDSISSFLNSVSTEDKKFVMFEEGLHRHWNINQCDNALENVLTWINPRL